MLFLKYCSYFKNFNFKVSEFEFKFLLQRNKIQRFPIFSFEKEEIFIKIPGFFAKSEPHQSIPNLVVKRSRSEDTERVAFWENNLMPGIKNAGIAQW